MLQYYCHLVIPPCYSHVSNGFASFQRNSLIFMVLRYDTILLWYSNESQMQMLYYVHTENTGLVCTGPNFTQLQPHNYIRMLFNDPPGDVPGAAELCRAKQSKGGSNSTCTVVRPLELYGGLPTATAHFVVGGHPQATIGVSHSRRSDRNTEPGNEGGDIPGLVPCSSMVALFLSARLVVRCGAA